MNDISEVVSKFLQESGLSLRGFAAAFSERLSMYPVSHATVLNWREGRTEPDVAWLLRVLGAYRGRSIDGPGKPDWRQQFAAECLRLRFPELDWLWWFLG